MMGNLAEPDEDEDEEDAKETEKDLTQR